MSKKKNPLLGEEETAEEKIEGEAENDGTAPQAPEVGIAKPVAKKADASKMSADSVANTRAILEKSRKVNFIIPLSPFEKPGAYDTVRINGYRLTIQKGVMVEIPEQVAKILAEKYRIAMTAGQDKLAGRDSNVSSALS
jgi:hypothetical protein